MHVQYFTDYNSPVISLKQIPQIADTDLSFKKIILDLLTSKYTNNATSFYTTAASHVNCVSTSKGILAWLFIMSVIAIAG